MKPLLALVLTLLAIPVALFASGIDYSNDVRYVNGRRLTRIYKDEQTGRLVNARAEYIHHGKSFLLFSSNPEPSDDQPVPDATDTPEVAVPETAAVEPDASWFGEGGAMMTSKQLIALCVFIWLIGWMAIVYANSRWAKQKFTKAERIGMLLYPILGIVCGLGITALKILEAIGWIASFPASIGDTHRES